MRYTHEGLVESSENLSVVVGVSPANPSNTVSVRYRVVGVLERTGPRELSDAAEQAFFEAYQDAPESDAKAFIQQSLHYMIDRTS